MKNITRQYQDLLEGKISKDNFMRSVRRDFPQWISPVNSFSDAVNILKSKRILSEMRGLGKWAMGDISQEEIADKWARLEPNTRDSVLASAGVKDAETREILGGFDYVTMMERLPDYVDAEEVINYIKNPPSDYMQRRMGEASAGNHSGRISGESAKVDTIGDPSDKELADMYAKSLTIGQDPEIGGDELDRITKGDDREHSKKLKETITLEPEIEKALKQLDSKEKEGLVFWLKKTLAGKKAEPKSADVDPSNPFHTAQTQQHQFGGVFEKDTLKEAVQKPEGAYKNVTGKAEYDKFAEMDRVDYRQLRKGTEFELLKMPEITDENLVKAKTKAYKALLKNPKAYMHLVTANADSVEKRDKNLRMQPVKEDNKVDKANAMKVIKKDEGSNTQTNQGNKERAKGLPKGIKIMKEGSGVKTLREALILEFTTRHENQPILAKGSQVQTPDGLNGTIEELTPDNTATVVYEDGSKQDYQTSVLKTSTMESTMQEAVKFPDLKKMWNDMTPQQKVMSLKKNKFLGSKTEEQYTELAKQSFEDLFFQGTEKRKELGIPPYAALLQGFLFSDSNPTTSSAPTTSNEEGADKHASLKEKLVKALMEDPKVDVIDTDIEKKEKEIAQLYIKKGQEFAKPGTQG